MNERNVTLVIVGTITVAAVAGVVVLSVLLPSNSTSIAVIVGFLVPTVTALLALLKAQDTHSIVNSRITKLLDVTDRLARSEGRAAAVAEREVEDRANDLLDRR